MPRQLAHEEDAKKTTTKRFLLLYDRQTTAVKGTRKDNLLKRHAHHSIRRMERELLKIYIII